MDLSRLPARALPEPWDPEGWWARWPHDAEALLRALAVAAAFAHRLPELRLAVDGDVDAAGAMLLERLALAGVREEDLPDVGIAPGRPGDPARHVARLPDRLALAGEYGRMPSQGWEGSGHDAVWAAAACAVSLDAPVLAVAETLAGAPEVADVAPLTGVAQSALTRRRLRALRARHASRAVPRPPSAADLPAAALVALDGRHPEDLRLAAAPRAERIAIARGERLSAPALEAFGLSLVERGAAAVLAAPRQPRRTKPMAPLAPGP